MNKPNSAIWLIVLALLVPLFMIMSLLFIAGGPAEEEVEEHYCQQYGAETASQAEYIRTVIGVAKSLDIGKRGQTIAVMTMLVESSIQMYANEGGNSADYQLPAPGNSFWLGAAKKSMKMPHDAVSNDADSVGLFQQRASAGWANSPGFDAKNNPKQAIERLMNPVFSAQAFFGGPGGPSASGLRDISGWQSMPMGEAAQAVQGSDYPSRYAERQAEAIGLVAKHKDAPAIDLDTGRPSDGGDGSATTWQKPIADGAYTLTSEFGYRDIGSGLEHHGGQDFAAPLGTPMHAIGDGTVVAAGTANGFGNWVVIDHGNGAQKISSVYGHMPSSSITVAVGDKVTAGQQIATVGSEGRSTGPHLHLEIWKGGRFEVGGNAVDPMPVLNGADSPSGGTACDSDGGVEADGTAAAVIEAGKEQLGVPYSWSGGDENGPSEGSDSGAGIVGFDCSGLMQYMLYQGADLQLPRVAVKQYQHTKGNEVGKAGITADDLEPGDLLYWGSSGNSIYHTAMYIGDGKMIEAPRPDEFVQITDVRLDGEFYAATRPNYQESDSDGDQDGQPNGRAQ